MKLNEDAHGDVKVVCSFSKESSIFNSLSVDGMNLEIRMCFRYSNTITFYDNFFCLLSNNNNVQNSLIPVSS